MKNKKRLLVGKQGFTLVELLVAMTIFAVVSSIALVSFRSSRISGRDSKRKVDLEQIRSALEMYRADDGSYPLGTDISALSALSDYLEVPIDPLADSGRVYYYSSGGQTYTLCAALEGNTTDASCGGSCGETCSYKVVSP